MIISPQSQRFTPDRLREYYVLLNTKNPVYFSYNLRKVINLRQLWQNKIRLVNNKFIPNFFDSIIYGSDEIWNTQNALVSSSDYFFGGVFPNSNLPSIAYSPSCGSLPPDYRYTDSIISKIKSFTALSARDKNTCDIIKNNIGSHVSVPITLDPTLINSDFKRLASHTNISQKYILIYGHAFSKNIISSITSLAARLNLKVYSIGYKVKSVPFYPYGSSLSAFLQAIRDSQFVYTSMFHGCMISLAYEKQFLFVHSVYRNNKVLSTLERLNLKDRVLNIDHINLMTDFPSIHIDYNKVSAQISSYASSSLDYLARSL